MEEQTKEIAVTNDEMKAMMKQMSGGGSSSDTNFFVPIIEVSNEKVTKMIDGEEEQVLGKKEFKVTRKIGDEFITEPFKKDFECVVLKTRYMVEKKWKKDDPTPYYRSYEIDNTQKENIKLYAQGEVFFDAPYADFKDSYEGTYVFYVMSYILIDGEIMRVKLKGESRQNYFTYMRGFRGDDDVSYHETKYTLIKVKGDSFSYHVAEIDVTDKEVDLKEIFETQKQLVSLFEAFKEKSNTEKGEVDTSEIEALIVE